MHHVSNIEDEQLSRVGAGECRRGGGGVPLLQLLLSRRQELLLLRRGPQPQVGPRAGKSAY